MRQVLYTALLRLASPALLARLARRARANGVPVARWREWLGFGESLAPGSIWLHAASVGEVEAALPLARALRSHYPGRALLMTTTTPEGAARVEAALGNDVQHAYLPLDLPGAVCRFLRRARPAAALIIETELWPNLYRACERAGIPLWLVSARLSPRSLKRYRRLQPLVRETLERAEKILAQDESAARGFRELGASNARVQVMGNLKFDRALPPGYEQAGKLRASVAPEGVPVWVAVSTREGEEEAVLEAHRVVRESHPGTVLFWVPRHRNRFDVAFEAARQSGFSVGRRTQFPSPPVDVLVGDTIGEIGIYLGAADVAFVGGSLVPQGGQNVLEPAALGLPVIVGPSTEHFAFAVEQLEQRGALWCVQDAAALGRSVTDLLRDPGCRRSMGNAARSVIEEGRGAVDRVLAEMEPRLHG
ncbi:MULTISPECIES: lipid IV(A) 3-deoxy-D-manno-octulosonic acid transferase [unclassified Thioalkalivibrio]|uniref:lipid IV(A) 3-deoxy-D-manno-octulosonic acid transferase n=1 Tax=unclassified Thioalkalivibrio TaxID=2621013 RepID=UPI0003774E3C|nr:MULTISPECIES: lipid IV(A) 3-deoxy-D-manno-octulosonic acid transferase [unclassified Thioalkalivibrio]